MRKISIKARGSAGRDWDFFDEDAQRSMPEVQCFAVCISVKDVATVGTIVWLKITEDGVQEVLEAVEIVSMDVKG